MILGSIYTCSSIPFFFFLAVEHLAYKNKVWSSFLFVCVFVCFVLVLIHLMAFCSNVKTYLHLVFLRPSVFLNRLPLGNTAAIIVTIIKKKKNCCCCCWKIVWVQGGTQNWKISNRSKAKTSEQLAPSGCTRCPNVFLHTCPAVTPQVPARSSPLRWNT